MLQTTTATPVVETGGTRLGIGFVGGLVAAAVFGSTFRGGAAFGGWGAPACGGAPWGAYAGAGYPPAVGFAGGAYPVASELAVINQNNNDRAQWEAIARLSERSAIAETRAEDNYAFDKERSYLTNQLVKSEIREATCDFLPARKMIRPEDMGSPYHGGQNLLVSTHIPPHQCGFTPFINNNCNPCHDRHDHHGHHGHWDRNGFFGEEGPRGFF